LTWFGYCTGSGHHRNTSKNEPAEKVYDIHARESYLIFMCDT
jgi:hypothetical protein